MDGDIVPVKKPDNDEAAQPPTPESTADSVAVNPAQNAEVVSSAQPEAAAAAPAPEAPANDTAVPAVATNDTNYHHRTPTRWVALLVVVLLLAAAAVGLAQHLSKQGQPTAVSSTSAKHEVSLLSIGMQQPVGKTLYPAIGSNNADVEIQSQIFEGLTKFESKTKVAPALATSWTNPDNTTWLFKLRSGVKFHDGNSLTAQAVKASLDASHDTPYWQQYGDTIKDVTAVDANTVKITTAAPDPLLATKLCYFWIFDTQSKTANDGASGTGPYQVKPGTTLDGKSVDLTAYNQYYGGRPGVQELKYTAYESDDTSLADLQQHKIDATQFVDTSFATKAGTGYHLYTATTPSVAFLIPNTLRANSPLQKTAVRQAMYVALDPQALMKARGLQGKPASQVVPELIPGYDSNIKRPAVDTAKAKQLLTQAGYPNGITLNFTYFHTAQNLAEEIKKELAVIGVNLTLDPQTDGATLQKKAFGGQTDLFYLTQSSDLIDAGDVIDGLVIQANSYHSDTVTQLNKQAASELDPAKRLKLLQQMNDALMSDYAVLPLYEPNGYTFVFPANLQFTQDTFSGITGVNWWKAYSN